MFWQLRLLLTTARSLGYWLKIVYELVLKITIILLPQLLCTNLEGYSIKKFTWINEKEHFKNALAIYEVHVSALNSFMKTTYLCSSL